MELGFDAFGKPSSISIEAFGECRDQASIQRLHERGILPIDNLDLDPTFHLAASG